ncbi:MAG TPA: GMC family oxidoreductase N-terminal domain-containing protein, partial [Stellaceae bacterium]|nr:GMC family oxidoreductase N-terminal domain-containing protein [Stellaceae bacterium]
IPYPRGRVLGGSSSINGLIYIRGQPEDFDHWAQLGNRGWGWDDVLPYFKQAENWQGETSELHGTSGFLTTSPMSERPAACHAIIAAAQELGLEYRPDVNNLPPGAGDSIGWCQQTRGGRRRASAARTYLKPALKRPNLQIVTKALAHRILFDGKRAVGVEFSRGGGAVERADAAREVILAAGAIGSPHLLQLSGVGDPEVLAKAGIAVHHALPGVGRNFQDHYVARMSCEVQGVETLNERGRGLAFAGELMRYAAAGKGMLTYSASLCAASVKVLPESATPDVQCVFAPASYKPGLIRKLDDKPGITGGPWQMRPLSRGYVLVRSPDPREQPAINPRYLAEDADRRAMVGGLKFLRRLFAAPSLAKHIVAETVPGPKVQSDDELLDYARQNGATVYHASCSCMMGTHALAVVDSELRVHGLDALRVIDASVMPAVTSTNTNAPTIMIAEKGAATILADARQKLAA